MASNQNTLPVVQSAVARDALSRLLEKSLLIHFDQIVPPATEVLQAIEKSELSNNR